MKILYIARSISFLLFSTIYFAAYTQTKTLRFEHYFLERGLPNIPIQCLLQDSKGYLWFGTIDGLVKCDGSDFIYYRHIPYDTTSLIDNWIISLWEDKDGMVWIGTAEAGLSKFDRRTGKFTQYRPEPDSASFVPPFRAVSAISEDGDGSLWAGNWLGELRRFNKRTGTYFSEKYDLGYRRDLDTIRANNTIHVIFKDRSGIIWIGDNTGLHKLNSIPGKTNEPSKIRFTHYPHDPDNPNSISSNMVTSIFEDHTGMLWIGTGGWGFEGRGLNRLDPKTGTFTHYLHKTNDPHSISSNTIFINNIAEDTAGNLWIGTENGLNKLNKDRTQFTNYFHDPNNPESIGGNGISSLLIDRSHTLWAGVGGTGLDKIDPNQKPFEIYRHNPSDPHSLSNDIVTGIYGDNKGIVWISTAGGLNAFEKNTGTFTPYRHKPNDPATLWNNNIIRVVEDRDKDGNIWVYSGNSWNVIFWYLFNSETGRFTRYPRDSARFREIYKDNAYLGYEDSHGLLWLGTTNGLKSFDRKTGEINHYRHDPHNLQGPADNTVITILEDKRGNLWMGHNSVGITKLDMRSGIFSHYLPDVRDSTSLSSPVINCIYQDSKENLWFGTKGGGLCRFNYEKETFTTYSEKQGLADNNIFSIKEDKDGNLWLGTVRGISRFSPAMQTFMNYDSADGLPGTIFSNISFSDKDGILYYGGSNGLTAFDPRKLKSNPYSPPVVITQFKLFDKPVLGKNEAEEILLNHDENFFSFEFSALNYSNSSKNQYAYQLVGVDGDWVYSGTRRLASYTNIGPGEYVFKVKASNNDGVWNEKGTSVRIIIRPPWWRTNWAYAFYGLCFLAVGFAIDRYQRRRLIRRERERARERELVQAKEIEKAYGELKATQAQLIQSEKMASLGELTAGIAHEIQNPLNFVNNFSEVNADLLADMSQEIDKGNLQEAKTIANNIIQNEQKIIHHGKRADAIVKNMLQHSRVTTGQKESTDINGLADEYLRLSFHGFRAKDKSFNATVQTDFDAAIGKINIISQDMGRVFLNLFTNAFYSVTEKNASLRASGQASSAGQKYEPTVSVSTKKMNNEVRVKVKDNGMGIPQKVLDKIYQPFFTTKPTGQGTGLGLSLSYDIIKAHGGEIKVETIENEGAEFTIILPM